MSISQLIALIAQLAAGVCAARFPFLEGIGRSQQMGPSQDRAGPGNDLLGTALGRQRDLFGTPFGPPFCIQVGAKCVNLPDIRRNPGRGNQVCTKGNVAREAGSWRRGTTPNRHEAFPASQFPDGQRPARDVLFMVPAPVLPRRIAGASAPAPPQLRGMPGSRICLAALVCIPGSGIMAGMMRKSFFVVIGLLCLPVAACLAAEPLAPVYESKSIGLALRPPVGCVVTPSDDPEQLLVLADPARKWNVRITRVMLPLPMALSEADTAALPAPRAGSEKSPTFMDQAVDQFMSAAPDAQLLRKDDTIIGKRRIGLLALRHTLSSEHRLTQEAILQLTPRMYYLVELNTPGAKPGSELDDPSEADAKETFRQMINTIRLLDQSALREDQDQRLFRTRSLFVGLSEAVYRKALTPETYLRHLKDGKDVGYSYVVEEPYESAGQKGFRVGVRSRMMLDGKQRDSESWYFMAWDRRHEDFSVIDIIDNGKEKSATTELGVSNREIQRRLDRESGTIDKADPKQPPVQEIERASLSVSVISKSERKPGIELKLPVFYIPLALDYVLARVVPQDSRTYMVARWDSDRQRLAIEYVDVGREEMTMLGDQTVRGLTVRTRQGLEGDVTTTYVSREGKFVGRINEADKTITLPTTFQDLSGRWKNADLSRPKGMESK